MKHPKTYSLPAFRSLPSSSPPTPTPPSNSEGDSVDISDDDADAEKNPGKPAAFHPPLPFQFSLETAAAPQPKPEFIELLARSNFSFLQGASHPEELVLQAKTLGYRGLALSDVNGLYGVVRGFQAAERPSVFDVEQLALANPDGSPKDPFQYICGSELTPYDASPLVLMPMNKDGYVRLCRLVTAAKRRAPKGHIVLSLQHILDESDDLIAIALPPWNEDELKKIQDVFKDRVYLPVCKDFSWESVRYYQQAMHLERSLGLALFASNRPLFHEPSRKPLHDIVTCILHKTTLDESATRLTLNRERYLKSPEQIAQLFRERPDLLARTLEIADRIKFSLTELRYRYPREDLPEDKTATEYLRELVEKGVRRCYPDDYDYNPPWRRENERSESREQFMAKVHRQVDAELGLIQEKEYEDYFLTLWDICNFAQKKGILFQGRGSAANSIVCFALGLTSVDPVKYRLLFGRFISKERNEPPDIDIDFEHDRREEVIQYIYTKYGERRAAMVCTVITYRSRMAIREVAKAMGIPIENIGALVKYMGREGLSRLVDIALEKGLENERPKPPINSPVHPLKKPEIDAGSRAPVRAPTPAPQAELAAIDLMQQFGLEETKFQKLLRLALEMQGFPRHLGIHSGGFVISHEPIVDIVPVEAATMEGRFVIQWNKDDIAILGLMKIDILALGMLSAVRKSLVLLKKHKNIDYTLATIPAECPATYKMIQKADTVGVFQIESRAQMSLLPRLKPVHFYDLVIEVAIVRPGPIQGGMVHPYLKRREGSELVTYADAKLRPILEKTLGIPLFQEQVMQIVVTSAGFSEGEADELRRVVSSAWKKKPIMDGIRLRVINGMLNNGLQREYAEQIYKTIEGFSSYGFPESHAASFALLTYVSCYLKHHHPDVFACSLLNSQPMGFYAPRQLIADAQRHGVSFHPLDVQNSDWDSTLEPALQTPVAKKNKSGLTLTALAAAPRVAAPQEAAYSAVRVGLRTVHGVRELHAQRLVEERAARGPFRDLTDLVRRTQLPRATLVRLASAGALAAFGLDARQALWALQGMSFDPQSLLFGAPQGLDFERETAEADLLPRESDWESMHREYKTKGFALDSHPLSVLRPQLLRSPQPYTTARQLEGLRNGTPLRVAGLMSLLQKPPTAKGMCFVSLEDETGIMNLVITPDVYQQCRLTLLHTPLLDVQGRLESRQGVNNIRVSRIEALKNANQG